jgi:hypothetical protein
MSEDVAWEEGVRTGEDRQATIQLLKCRRVVLVRDAGQGWTEQP